MLFELFVFPLLSWSQPSCLLVALVHGWLTTMAKVFRRKQEAEVTIKQPCVVLEVDGNSYPGGLGAIPAGTPFYGILQLLPGHHNIRFSYNNTTITDQGTFQVGRMVRHEYKTQTAIGSPIILDVNVKAGKKYVATGISIGNSWSVCSVKSNARKARRKKY